MTVKELKEALSELPDHMDVFMAERKTEYGYGLLNGIYLKEINFKESPDDDEVLCRETVIVLDEE